MTVPIPVTLAIATPDRTWHTEQFTLWLSEGETLDHDDLEAEATAAWTGAYPRDDAVHLWLMDEDDEVVEDAAVTEARQQKRAAREDDFPF